MGAKYFALNTPWDTFTNSVQPFFILILAHAFSWKCFILFLNLVLIPFRCTLLHNKWCGMEGKADSKSTDAAYTALLSFLRRIWIWWKNFRQNFGDEIR